MPPSRHSLVASLFLAIVNRGEIHPISVPTLDPEKESDLYSVPDATFSGIEDPTVQQLMPT